VKILVVDDDRDLLDMLQYSLQREGYVVIRALDGEAAVRAFQSEGPDLVILDLHLPKRSGMDVLREVRRQSDVPVLILSVVHEEDRVVSAIEIGADDYMAKPVRLSELRARVKALLRGTLQLEEFAPKPAKTITLGEIHLDLWRHQVTVSAEPVKLTPTEFALLHYMMLNYNRVVPLSDLIANVWGYDAEETENTVRVVIYRLRQKIEPDPTHPIYLINLSGFGYKFEVPVLPPVSRRNAGLSDLAPEFCVPVSRLPIGD
jgi:two-component system, OmpR family, response regulator RegX3